MDIRKFKTAVSLLILVVVLFSLGFTLYLTKQAQIFQKKASSTPTIITVDMASVSPLPRIWQYLAQGGEVPIPQLTGVVNEIKELTPLAIRLDHIFDAYRVVSKNDKGQLIYDFSLLDREVDAIIKAGAKPFLSLSYVPPDLADPANPERPASYALWQELVMETVAHYSGKANKNISGVYYEVYNEPDLFGKWSPPDYMLLYEASVKGAAEAPNTNPFLIGGPGITSFMKTFMETFFNVAQNKNLRVDFVSWHAYYPNVNKITQDAALLGQILSDQPQFQNVRKIVSEWGSFPEKHLWHDTIFDNSHIVATVSRSLSAVDELYYFEVKDGKSLTGDTYFGGWGILTGEESGFIKKPRYFALQLLNKLKPLKFSVTGENENISAIASGNNTSDLTLILTHYSAGAGNAPLLTPVRFTHLLPGAYSVAKTVLDDRGEPRNEAAIDFTVDSLGSGGFDVDMVADSIIVLDIIRAAAATVFGPGESGSPQDKAAQISPNTPLFYSISSPVDPKINKVVFSLQLATPSASALDKTFLESSGSGSLIHFGTQVQGFTKTFTLSVADDKGIISNVSLPAVEEALNTWHKIELLFNNSRGLLSLTVDGKVVEGALNSYTKLGSTASFGGFDGAVDSVRITIDGKTVVVDDF